MPQDNSFRPPLPPWIRVRVSCGETHERVGRIVEGLGLHTVCQGAHCPNRGECWGRGTATFMILGANCTRHCKFCAVGSTALPLPPDPEEPEKVARAAKEMNLNYVVVTSVTRGDLPDGGASIFAATTAAIKRAVPGVRVEILVPDFNGVEKDIETSMRDVDVFNHNVETVERMSPLVRNKAKYRRSLGVLAAAHRLSGGKTPVKSGIMVGLGETDEEVEQTILDIRATGAEILTIGQYLPPSAQHWKLDRYVTPETFRKWSEFASKAGFRRIAAGPLVRSSYNAGRLIMADGEVPEK